MNESETKTCPLCCEQVHPKARKCPHCQHFLNKWTLIAYHPLFALLPMILLIFGGGYFLSRIFQPGEDFGAYRSQVHVSHSEMKFGTLSAGPTVSVVGTITNDSRIAWKEVTIDVQFFDKARKLIDTKQSAYTPFFLPANSSCAFKVSMPREFDIGNYNSYDVRVLSARDSRSFF